jgi:hypothetical protein
MKRALFLISLAAAAVTLTSLSAARSRNRRASGGTLAGACANHHCGSRWSAYTAADFS